MLTMDASAAGIGVHVDFGDALIRSSNSTCTQYCIGDKLRWFTATFATTLATLTTQLPSAEAVSEADQNRSKLLSSIRSEFE
jgi:hypothetical protein